MPEFKTTPYGDDDSFMLVKIEKRDHGEGLPPTYSQCMMMKKSEIEDLIKCLQEMK